MRIAQPKPTKNYKLTKHIGKSLTNVSQYQVREKHEKKTTNSITILMYSKQTIHES